jgi:hypothetical protein
MLGAVIALIPACFLITDFDFDTPPVRSDASQGGGTGTGGAGGGAAGEGGAGARPGCALPGDGPAATGAPWVVPFGPIDPALDWPLHPSLAATLVTDKIVFTVPLFRSNADVRLGEVTVATANDDRFVVGWIDDGGQDFEAWELKTLGTKQDSLDGSLPMSHAAADVAPWIDRRVLVGMAEGAGFEAAVVELDLCSREREEVRLVQCGGSAFPRLDTDPGSGRIVLSLQLYGSPSCYFNPDGPFAGCTVPAAAQPGGAMLFSVENAATQPSCQSFAAKGYGFHARLVSDGVALLGAYTQSSIVLGPFTVQSGEDAVYNHGFFAKLMAPDLAVSGAFDLGRIAGYGIFDAVALGADALVASAIDTAPYPDGSILAPGAQPQGSDLLVAHLGPAGPVKPPTPLLYGGTAGDFGGRLTRTPSGITLSGRTVGTSAFGICQNAGGCAFFASLSQSDLKLDSVLLLDSAGGAPERRHGYVGWLVPGSELLIVGSTDDDISLTGDVVPGPRMGAGFQSLFFAREPQR